MLDLGWPGEGLPGEGGFREDAPPALLKVEPAGADGDEDVPDSGVVLEPGAGGHAVVRGQVIRDHIDVPDGIGSPVFSLLRPWRSLPADLTFCPVRRWMTWNCPAGGQWGGGSWPRATAPGGRKAARSYGRGWPRGWASAYAERAATSAQKFPNCPTRQGRFCDHRPVPRASDT